jgi:hypothetical protein
MVVIGMDREMIGRGMVGIQRIGIGKIPTCIPTPVKPNPITPGGRNHCGRNPPSFAGSTVGDSSRGGGSGNLSPSLWFNFTGHTNTGAVVRLLCFHAKGLIY